MVCGRPTGRATANHLGDIVGGQPLQGVVDEGHAHQGQQHLGPLQCDGPEALQQARAVMVRHLKLLASAVTPHCWHFLVTVL